MRQLKFFAGANTAKGFYSHYQYLAQDSFRRVFILKGGPGTGKSTLIRRIAKAMGKKYPVDWFHCSADVESLDGVYIHDADVSILDGTAPHVTDPRLPGAVQQIVDLGAFWNQEELLRNKDSIRDLSYGISAQYKTAYKWLKIAAGLSHLDQQEKNFSLIKKEALKDAKDVMEMLPVNYRGRNWEAFATAITSDGLVSYLPALAENAKTKVYLTGGNWAYNSLILNKVKERLQENELPATYLYCGLQPNRLEHIYIPNLFGIFSIHQPHSLPSKDGMVLGAQGETTSVEDQLYSVINKAIAILARAKQLHKELEKIYIPTVDFDKIESVQDLILQQVQEM